MQFSQMMTFEFARMEREERMREAERFRRAAEARSHRRRQPAARRERRFPFFATFFRRPREA